MTKSRSVHETFSRITTLDLASSEITVCVGSTPGDVEVPAYQRLNITDEVRLEFENIVRDARFRLEDNDIALRPYDAGSKPDQHEVEYIAMKDVQFIAMQCDPLAASIDFPLFLGTDERFLLGLRFYVIVIQQTGEKPAYWFRGYTSHKELAHSTVFGITMRVGQFDRVRDPLFMFDRYLDCVVFDEWMFVFRQDGFQKVFRYFEMVRRAAAESLDRIKATIPILNFDDFRDACGGHLQKLAKLRNIAQKPYLDSITISDIKRAIKRFKLPVTIERQHGKEFLVYDPADKWAILRLLDDDYLESVMTTQTYEVTGKRVHQTGAVTTANAL